MFQKQMFKEKYSLFKGKHLNKLKYSQKQQNIDHYFLKNLLKNNFA